MIKQKVICLTLSILLLGLLTCNPLVVHATGPSNPVIGVYGINYYTAGNNLAWSIKSVDDLYSRVISNAPGWHGAWDLHDWDVYPGQFHIGTESRHVNNVDLGYFSGHGQTDHFCASPQQYNYAWAYLCRWGGSAKWIGLDACLCGYDNSFVQSMSGLHELCTFCTNSYDKNPTMGGQWANYMTAGWSIQDSWIYSNWAIEEPGTGVKIFYAQGDGNDYLWNVGSVGPDPTSSTPIYSYTSYK